MHSNSGIFAELPLCRSKQLFDLSGIELAVHSIENLEPLKISACDELIDVPLGSVSEIMGGEMASGNKQNEREEED